MKILMTILMAGLTSQTVMAQPSADYLTKVCTPAISKSVLKNYKKSDGASVTDVNAYDTKTNQVVGKYTGTFEVVVAIESQECYEGYRVKTKVEYKGEAKTPSCKVVAEKYMDRDCA